MKLFNNVTSFPMYVFDVEGFMYQKELQSVVDPNENQFHKRFKLLQWKEIISILFF